MTGPARHDVHQWAGEDPDFCVVCDVSWSDADLTCTPTAGRVMCSEMNAGWGCLKDSDHDGKHWSVSHGVEVEWDPIDWAAEQAELDELERTDPDVAAAAASYDRMVERMTGHLTAYTVTVAGCDDETVAVVVLSEAEHVGLEKLARALRVESHYGCMPTMTMREATAQDRIDASERARERAN